MKNIFTDFDKGIVSGPELNVQSESLAWNPHPTCAGVSLKHLVTGKETDGAFSVHLVKLDPEAEIVRHVHQSNWELHEVVGGSGACRLAERTLSYTSGTVAITPKNVPHSVHAGKEGLCMLSKFIPALT